MAKKITLTLDDGEVLKVNEQWNVFARNFALTGNASKARIDAGYANHEESRINAGSAYKMLQKPVIQKLYEHYKRQLAKKIDISENRILAEMAALGFSNLARIYDENGQFKPIHEIDKTTQHAIKSIKTRRYVEKGYGKGDDNEVEVIAIEMHGKLPALKEIAAIKGITQEEKNRPIAVTVNVNGHEVKVDQE